MYVVTLIARALKNELVDDVSQALLQAGAPGLIAEWLSPGKACDIQFNNIELDAARQLVAEVIGQEPCDAVVQLLEGRRKKLLISDMDSTMIEQECIDELAAYAGLKAQVSAITERAMNGELDFAQALTARVRLLEGLPESVLQQVYDTKIHYMPGARTLVQTMKADGSYCALVSGGFTFFTGRVAEYLGFDCHESNILAVKDGVLTGAVVPPIRDKNSKLERLNYYVMKRDIKASDVLAVGDGANDVPMLQAAGLGVAYHAKPRVQEQVNARINHNDLTALLYVQGIKDIEWVRG